MLHVDKREKPSMDTEHKEPVACNITVSHKTFGHTGAGKDCCRLSIVPVHVKSIKGDQILHYLCISRSWQHSHLLSGASYAKAQSIFLSFSCRPWDRKWLCQLISVQAWKCLVWKPTYSTSSPKSSRRRRSQQVQTTL